jgi:hypothetical protein
VIFAESIIQPGFENLDALPCDLRPAQAADQFLAFSAEHAAADDFDPTKIYALMVQLLAHKGRPLYL